MSAVTIVLIGFAAWCLFAFLTLYGLHRIRERPYVSRHGHLPRLRNLEDC